MTTDSIFYDIPSKEFADSLFSAVNVVSRHTDSLRGFSAWVTLTSFLASIATIIGIVLILKEIHNIRTTKRCQEKIILDLIRHFFTNNCISEAIRIKLKKNKGLMLKEGILQRYCVLSSDIELGNLSYSAKSYETLHSLRMKLRNYNITALAAEKHFTDPACPADVKTADLDDILERSIRLTKEFLEFAKQRKMKVDAGTVRRYIRQYYEARMADWEKAGKINRDIRIPQRTPATNRAFYDEAPYELGDIVDLLIRERYSYAKEISE